MRRLIAVLASLSAISSVFCQNSKKIIDQFNVQAFESSSPAEAKATIGKDEELTIYNLNDFNYTLTPEKGKDYKSYQAIRLDGLTSRDIVVGMITSTLEREDRYIEITAGERQYAMVREVLDEKADYVFVSPFEKEYFIAADGTFRYIDGRELVGSKKVKTYLEKGKPVTETTFFFAMKDRGLINADVSLRSFISLSLEEKVSLLDMDIYASPKKTAGEPAITGVH
ncbi:MAG TPA: hypothetical protein VNJ07_11950 [Chitinophagales bacterium]|nr:hypothetical protein [Chitinophagales bacterium]